MTGALAAMTISYPSSSPSRLGNFLIGSHKFVGEKSTANQRTLTARFPCSRESLPSRFSHNSGNVICKISEDVVIQGTDAKGRERRKASGKSEALQNSAIPLDSKSKPKEIDDQNIKFPFYSHISNRVIDALERGLVWAVYGSSKPTNYYTLGNYAPVEEFGPESVPSVTGYIPECLNGEVLRIGPNPKFNSIAKYHWFDGDGYAAQKPLLPNFMTYTVNIGSLAALYVYDDSCLKMLHGVRIKDGKVTYSCRYVRTARLQQEEYWGGPKVVKVGDMIGLKGVLSLALYEIRGRLGVLDFSKGVGTANTALVYHNGKLLALQETDMPYVVRVLDDGALETVSRLDYDKKLDHPFTAHPKIDPVTGEMFIFGYKNQVVPDVTYRVISKDGVMGRSVPITISRPVMMHDFAITENYAIFVDGPLCFNPQEMARKDQLVFEFDETKPLRFGVLPRYAIDDSQIQWFDCPSAYILHTGNAWEEGEEVVLIACQDFKMDLEAFSAYDKDRCQATTRYLWEYRFNLKTGNARERMLGEFHVEFPLINEEYVGRKNRYVYAAIFEDTTHIIGIAKYDLTKEPELGKTKFEVGGNVSGVIWHGSARYGSDHIYVPKNPGREVDEDDGYLLWFVFDENTRKSELIVADAKTMSSEPVAVIEMPSRIPFGFHVSFLTEEQLQSQK